MTIQRTSVYWFCLPLVLIFGLWAQTTGTLSGTVNNAAGAAVPNATVTVTPAGGGAAQKSLTGQDGRFSISGLPPGSYTVEVEYSGYKRTSVQNIDLSGGNAANIKVELQQGAANETVELAARAVLVQTDSGQTANAIDARTVNEVPVLDRNHQQLVELLPGITPPQTNPSVVDDPQQSRFWQTNGLSDTANRRTLDGVENGEPFTGTSVYVTPEQGVQQFNVLTSNYDAKFSRAGGAIIDPITRAGTNGFHGSLFEFNANSALAARNFFDPKGYSQAHSNVNQTGASLGGPIRRDKTFFFANFEGDFNRTQNPTLSTVPTGDLRSGNFSAVPGLTLFNPNSGLANGANRVPFPNNIIPARQISPVAQSFLRDFPQPNASGFENNLLVNVPLTNDGYRGDLRFDHKAGDNLNLFARYSYSEYMTSQGSVLGALGGTDGHLQNHNAMIGGTMTVSPSLVGDLRLGFTRYADKLNNQFSGITPASLGLTDPNSSLFASSGFGNLGLPQIQIGGMSSFGANGSLPQYNTDNNFNLVNSWNYLTGRNNFHAGFDIYYIQGYGFQNYAFGPQGGFVFGPGATASPAGAGLGPFGTFANSFGSFLLGTPSQAGRNLPNYVPGYTSWQGSGYIADTIKLTDRFTVDIGAHYDVFSPLALRHTGGVSVYNPATNQLTPIGSGGIDNMGNMQTNWNNIAPRIGFAYRPMERTVIRGGYGINYFQGPLSFYASSLISNVGVASGGLPGSFATVGSLDRLPSVATSAGGTMAPNTPLVFSPANMRTPYVQNFDFLIEHDLGRYGLVASVGYVGNLGRELPYSRELNAALPGAGAAGQPFNTLAFARTASTIERSTGLNSNYNSLQARLSKRFSQNLSFTAAYTYSRALDYGEGGLNPLLNNLSVASNYGPADWDRTHMFTLSHVWQLPIGANSSFLSQGVIGKILGPWQLDGVFSWNSGTPFTLTADPTLCNCPGNTPTASTVVTGTSTAFFPVPTFFGFLPIPFRQLDFAYTQPPANSLGNLGRNSVRGPGFTNYNLSLFRSFVIHEQTKFEFRAEAYNIANTAHFANPIANVNSANFGQSISTLPFDPERRLQLSLRLVF